MRVLLTFQPDERLRSKFEDELGDKCDLIIPEDTEPEALLDLITKAEVVVGWQATEKMVEEAQNVRLWQNPGVGVTHLLPLFSEAEHITLANSHGNTYFTAQHAVSMLLCLMDKVHLHHIWMKEGRWRTRDDAAKSVPLRHRTVGIVGFGYVGQNVARFIGGFDVNIRAFKNSPKEGDEDANVTIFYRERGHSLVDFAHDSDILVVTLPLTAKTEKIIDKKVLDALGPSGLIVNVGRGDVIDEDYLYAALQNDEIAGAALDVWWREKDPVQFSDGGIRPFNRPFHRLDNVLMSPHRAASPFDDLARWDDVIENVKRAAEGRSDFLNVVDIKRGY